jgi:hypothetical protein
VRMHVESEQRRRATRIRRPVTTGFFNTLLAKSSFQKSSWGRAAPLGVSQAARHKARAGTGRPLGAGGPAASTRTSRAVWPPSTGGSCVPPRHSLRPQDRHRLAGLARGGLRLQRGDVLAATSSLDTRGRLRAPPARAARRSGSPWRHRLEPRRVRLGQCTRSKRGAHTGSNPTDRGKKARSITSSSTAQAIHSPRSGPRRTFTTRDVALPLVDAIPPVKGLRGRPRRRPAKVHADKAYDLPFIRVGLRLRHIAPRIARRGTYPGTRAWRITTKSRRRVLGSFAGKSRSSSL